MRYRKKEGGKRVAVVWVVAGLDHRGGGRRGVGGGFVVAGVRWRWPEVRRRRREEGGLGRGWGCSGEAEKREARGREGEERE